MEKQNHYRKQHTYAKDGYRCSLGGSFPIVKSKIPINLMSGEQVIIQGKGENYSGKFSVEGTITLTNKRILWNRVSGGKAWLKNPSIIGFAMDMSKPKEISFDLSAIQSIDKSEGFSTSSTGFKFATNNGESMAFAFRGFGNPSENRDKLVSLVKQAMQGDKSNTQ